MSLQPASLKQQQQTPTKLVDSKTQFYVIGTTNRGNVTDDITNYQLCNTMIRLKKLKECGKGYSIFS